MRGLWELGMYDSVYDSTIFGPKCRDLLKLSSTLPLSGVLNAEGSALQSAV